MRYTHAALAAAAFLALTGCSSDPAKPADPTKLDNSARLACDDFARGAKAAQTATARIALADKVNRWAQDSTTNRIPEMATALARGAEGSPGAWQLGADAFAQACLDAGWKG